MVILVFALVSAGSTITFQVSTIAAARCIEVETYLQPQISLVEKEIFVDLSLLAEQILASSSAFIFQPRTKSGENDFQVHRDGLTIYAKSCTNLMLLPSSPRSLCTDRFSLTDFVTDLVPSWSIIQSIFAVLPTSTPQLIEQLATVSVTFRGTAGSNFLYLEQFLDIWDSQRFFRETWSFQCVQLALDDKALFPIGSLPLQHLDELQPRMILKDRLRMSGRASISMYSG